MCTTLGLEMDFEALELDAENEDPASSAKRNESIGGYDWAKGIKCAKCGSQEIQMITIHGRNVYCEACFIVGSTHKFRAALGKHKAIRKEECVLVGHSGKGNSLTLLHLISAATKEPLHKKLIFQPTFLYIDDGAVKGRTIDERTNAIRDMSKQVVSFGLKGFATCLGGCLHETISASLLSAMNEPNASIMLRNVEKEDNRLRKIFDELEDDTAKDELLRKIRRMLLMRIARLLNCDKVLLADTSMDLAIKALSDISTGRGATISMDVAFLDSRSIEATILRPLRDFTQDEISWYLKLFVTPTALPTRSDKDRAFPASVRSVACQFLGRLDNEFHGTVAAIYKTSNKLVSAGYHDRQQSNLLERGAQKCVLCDNPAQSPTDSHLEFQLSAIQATVFSRLTSSSSSLIPVGLGPRNHVDDRPISCCPSSSQSCHCDALALSPASENSWQHYLCYSCKNIFRSSNPHTINESLSFLIPIVRRSINRQRMRADISNFLL